MLELRFPDTPEGWAAWQCIVDKIKEKGTPIGVRCEEIEPGKMRGTISEK